jgi:hypothetical protein
MTRVTPEKKNPEAGNCIPGSENVIFSDLLISRVCALRMPVFLNTVILIIYIMLNEESEENTVAGCPGPMPPSQLISDA